MPRIDRGDLLRIYGVEDLSRPLQVPATLLPEATAAAAALPDLSGHAPAAVSARRAAVVAAGGQLRHGQLAELLGISERSIRRFARRPANGALVQAVRLQACLRATLGRPELRLLSGITRQDPQLKLVL